MFTIPFHRDNILISSISDASTLLASKRQNVCVSMVMSVVCAPCDLLKCNICICMNTKLKFKIELTLWLHAVCDKS